MLFREIIAVCSEIHTRHTKCRVWGRVEDLLSCQIMRGRWSFTPSTHPCITDNRMADLATPTIRVGVRSGRALNTFGPPEAAEFLTRILLKARRRRRRRRRMECSCLCVSPEVADYRLQMPDSGTWLLWRNVVIHWPVIKGEAVTWVAWWLLDDFLIRYFSLGAGEGREVWLRVVQWIS